ncbi:hypothetical protein SODALDRAFT_58988 [Sodiomyces alkalinus F11]|uniref:Uncharacterized protein n=1 Tax=Sodiomyces alkalinus (strain CBS 110278 / VKM F-3762 / F11) TaxID=1314773 RepID=A0A3N2PNT2_SODAK|nr:hypothetical protein SODALDRAFT_58988 [Sodiomyces alkalinus F11]ROT36162.1 hypothetical protein SODALDRAFT_58988 [Sodiomyces alkalinus F11]
MERRKQQDEFIECLRNSHFSTSTTMADESDQDVEVINRYKANVSGFTIEQISKSLLANYWPEEQIRYWHALFVQLLRMTAIATKLPESVSTWDFHMTTITALFGKTPCCMRWADLGFTDYAVQFESALHYGDIHRNRPVPVADDMGRIGSVCNSGDKDNSQVVARVDIDAVGSGSYGEAPSGSGRNKDEETATNIEGSCYWPQVAQQLKSLYDDDWENVKMDCPVCWRPLAITGEFHDQGRVTREAVARAAQIHACPDAQHEVGIILPCQHIMGLRCFLDMINTPTPEADANFDTEWNEAVDSDTEMNSGEHEDGSREAEEGRVDDINEGDGSQETEEGRVENNNDNNNGDDDEEDDDGDDDNQDQEGGDNNGATTEHIGAQWKCPFCRFVSKHDDEKGYGDEVPIPKNAAALHALQAAMTSEREGAAGEAEVETQTDSGHQSRQSHHMQCLHPRCDHCRWNKLTSWVTELRFIISLREVTRGMGNHETARESQLGEWGLRGRNGAHGGKQQQPRRLLVGTKLDFYERASYTSHEEFFAWVKSMVRAYMELMGLLMKREGSHTARTWASVKLPSLDEVPIIRDVLGAFPPSKNNSSETNVGERRTYEDRTRRAVVRILTRSRLSGCRGNDI